MFLNNDDQQWWYFLVSAIGLLFTFLRFVWSSCFCGVDNQRLWRWWMRLPSVVCSVIGFCLPTFRCWNNFNEDDQQWFCLRSAFTLSLIIGVFLMAIWTRYCWSDNIQQLSSAIRIFLTEREEGVLYRLLTILAITMPNCIGEAVTFSVFWHPQ